MFRLILKANTGLKVVVTQSLGFYITALQAFQNEP